MIENQLHDGDVVWFAKGAPGSGKIVIDEAQPGAETDDIWRFREMQRGSFIRQILRRVDWVPVADKWCRVSIMGADLSPDALQKEESDKERVVILMIPGNPGNEGFYADFGERLLKNLMSRDERAGGSIDRTYLFYTISHLNHVALPPELDGHAGALKANDRFLLDAQVQHKLNYVRDHLPHATRVYLMGHSIGSYMMLRVLPYIVDDFNIKAAIALFPTVERMAVSPNGLRLRRVLAALDSQDWLAKALTFWLNFLPVSAKRWLVGLNLRADGIPPCVAEAAAELLNVNVFRNIVHMSNDELENINEFDEATLLQHRELVHFLYGTTDGWVPIEYGMEMAERAPSGHVIIDDKECEHAFVIKDGKAVAERLVPLIV
ncbi:hypothetical protein PRIPAC_73534 [Pristionchus pacificus]|uniref:Lipid droplet-associated hydrolase n=1 Tax=Pristionchus pacificus TaxID=54126 RepID=A0A2A6C8I7_PRIPA|nr:hypothetical protein PRIPAC_73534 [Pristionchus pacificus]|eukprot:PDM74427.1 hydrolase [Pristionchus pacificus]